MVTGASTADLAIVLVDARKGMLEQSRRHAFLASLLRVPHLVLCGQQDGPGRLLAGGLRPDPRGVHARSPPSCDVPDLTVIPISALQGDNVVTRSANMPWYDGPVAAAPPGERARGQRPQPGRRPVPGAVRDPAAVRRLPRLPRLRRARSPAACCKPGDEVMVLPQRAAPRRIAAIDTADGPVDEAFAPMSVTVRLEDDLDVSRGDMICRPHNAPTRRPGPRRDGLLDDRRSRCGRAASCAIKHTTRTARAMVKELQYRLDVNTLHRDEDADELGAQRHRPGAAAHHPAAVRRRVRAATGPPAGSS